MTSNVFTVDTLTELLVLQRVFREAKFCTEPDDTEISDSPIVANLFERLMTALVAEQVARDGEDAAHRWVWWRAIDESRDEWAAALRRAKAAPRWPSLSDDERAEYIRLLLSPFTVSPDIIQRFTSAVNRA